MNTERSVKPTIVVNPNSTNFRNAKKHAFAPLDQEKIAYDVFETRFSGFDDNVKDLQDRLPSGGRVISAAGDGTAEQVVSANVLGKKEQTLGFLNLGGFNDMASTHMDTQHGILDLVNPDTRIVEATPLSYEINEQEPRLAALYMTLGLTARIAAGYGEKNSRELLKRTPAGLQRVIRLGQAGLSYTRHSRTKLPALRVNEGDIIDDSTDIAISNNPVVAGLIKTEDSYFDTPHFGYRADLNMTSIFEAMRFGIPSLMGRSPLRRAEQLRIDFEEVAQNIPLQVGGEVSALNDVRTIFVHKDPKNAYRVLHPAQQR